MNRRFALLGLGALSLSACDPTRYGTATGAEIDEGAFGVPTAHNRGLMTGEIDAARILAARFERELNSVVNFEFNSAVLDAEAQQILLRQASWIRQFPELRFRVVGHTDLVGSERYNDTLGMRRARAVVNFITNNGVSRSRITAVVSRSEREPLIQTQEPERQNRRTVTQVSGFVRRHPTLLNGQYAQIINREYVESATSPHPRLETQSMAY